MQKNSIDESNGCAACSGQPSIVVVVVIFGSVVLKCIAERKEDTYSF